MKNIFIFPNTLIEDPKIITIDSKIYFIEHPVFFTAYSYHKQKLIFHRASMKYYFDFLRKKFPKNKFFYIPFYLWPKAKTKISGNIFFYDPNDHEVMEDIEEMKNKKNIFDNPIFLTEQSILKNYVEEQKKKKKKIIHKNFYIWQRKRLNLFVTKSGEPFYDEWSFDKKNRNPYPKNFKMKRKIFLQTVDHEYISKAKKYVNKYFSKNPGSDELLFPISFESSKKCMLHFLKYSLPYFGKYQDAIHSEIDIGYHSAMSPLMNVGLILPETILNKISKMKISKNIFPSIEGYIRQVIGWREYTRMFYLFFRKDLKKNYLNHKNKLNKDVWYYGSSETGIKIIDDTIKKVINIAYLHHIERLMVIGNFMLLLKIHPNEVFNWFMSMNIDSYNVFMYPNVYGMSQYSGANIMMTRPYFSSSNYLLKMSNYKKDEWTKIWDSLYYSFINDNKKIFSKNYSTANIVKLWRNKSSAEKKKIISIAKKYT